MADINVERKRKGSPLPWILGLLLLALLGFLLYSLLGRDRDPAPAPPTDTASAVVPPATDTAAMAMPGAAPVAAAAAGTALPVAAILDSASSYGGRQVSGTARVVEVPSDRGFWVEEGGRRLFAVLGEPQAAEQRIDINAGQTVQLSGQVYQKGAQLDQVMATGVEAETKRIADGEPAVLVVRPADVQVTGQGT